MWVLEPTQHSPGDRCAALWKPLYVEPALSVVGKLFMLGQLGGVHPFRDFQLPRLSEESCQSPDELLLVHVFHSNPRQRLLQ